MTSTRILVIEDEPDLRRGVELNLRSEGYDVLTAATGDSGVQVALTERPSLVLLDVMLPGKNGFDVCRELRQNHFESPIIMLTAKSDEVDRVIGLEIGADDYVTKPFSVRELLARIRVQLRRRTASPQTGAVLRFDDVTVDFEKCEATRGGTRIELTGKEYDVLRLLAEC